MRLWFRGGERLDPDNNSISTLECRYNINKAIRDGKYLARHMPVLGNIHPIKITCWYIFRDVISLLAGVVILLIDTATQEVPMKNIWKKLSVQFLRYAIKLLHVKRRTCHKWR